MNALTPVPPGRKAIAVRPPRSDQEFLPAALEILEVPPSPVGVALLWIICALAVATLAWAYFGRIDVIAVAQGKLQPTGRVKVIQPAEAGRITSVWVENGQHVAKGENLAGLESGEADADVNELRANLQSFQAEAARRRAALGAVARHQLAPLPQIAWTEDLPDHIKAREMLVLEGDLGQLATAVSSLQAQRRQKQLERDQYTATSAAVETLVGTLQQRVDMRASLERTGSGSKADLIDALEKLQDQKATLATAHGKISESDAAVEVLSQNIEDSYRTFTAQNLQKLAEAERQADDFAQRLAKARVRQSRMVLASPIAGTVSALSITTVGQVVAAGEELMRVVPEGASMEIECYIRNADIGFVRPGQQAVVKIESLPFTRYGTINATLTRVASDAIPEPEASQTEGNPTRSARDTGFAGAQRTQNLVFLTTLRPDATSVLADGVAIPLSPGMAVTVEVKTGSRRILEYVFSPLVEVAARAMRER